MLWKGVVLLKFCNPCGGIETERFPTGGCKPCQKRYNATPEAIATRARRMARGRNFRYCERCVNNVEHYANGQCRHCKISDALAYAAANPEVHCARVKRWQAAHRDKASAFRVNWQRGKSGWTRELFAKAWTNQNGLCAICKKPMLPNGKTKNSVVADHCHLTNKPRALLHSRCNTGIGLLEDDPATLRAAAEYIEVHRG